MVCFFCKHYFHFYLLLRSLPIRNGVIFRSRSTSSGRHLSPPKPTYKEWCDFNNHAVIPQHFPPLRSLPIRNGVPSRISNNLLIPLWLLRSLPIRNGVTILTHKPKLLVKLRSLPIRNGVTCLTAHDRNQRIFLAPKPTYKEWCDLYKQWCSLCVPHYSEAYL